MSGTQFSCINIGGRWSTQEGTSISPSQSPIRKGKVRRSDLHGPSSNGVSRSRIGIAKESEVATRSLAMRIRRRSNEVELLSLHKHQRTPRIMVQIHRPVINKEHGHHPPALPHPKHHHHPHPPPHDLARLATPVESSHELRRGGLRSTIRKSHLHAAQKSPPRYITSSPDSGSTPHHRPSVPHRSLGAYTILTQSDTPIGDP
jgi:hypothetical protein